MNRFPPRLNAARCGGCDTWIAEEMIRWFWTLGPITHEVCVGCAEKMAAFARNGNQRQRDALTKAYAIEYRRRPRR